MSDVVDEMEESSGEGGRTEEEVREDGGQERVEDWKEKIGE